MKKINQIFRVILFINLLLIIIPLMSACTSQYQHEQTMENIRESGETQRTITIVNGQITVAQLQVQQTQILAESQNYVADVSLLTQKEITKQVTHKWNKIDSAIENILITAAFIVGLLAIIALFMFLIKNKRI